MRSRIMTTPVWTNEEQNDDDTCVVYHVKGKYLLHVTIRTIRVYMLHTCVWMLAVAMIFRVGCLGVPLFVIVIFRHCKIDFHCCRCTCQSKDYVQCKTYCHSCINCISETKCANKLIIIMRFRWTREAHKFLICTCDYMFKMLTQLST